MHPRAQNFLLNLYFISFCLFNIKSANAETKQLKDANFDFKYVY